jgi:hypothetical protein
MRNDTSYWLHFFFNHWKWDFFSHCQTVVMMLILPSGQRHYDTNDIRQVTSDLQKVYTVLDNLSILVN